MLKNFVVSQTTKLNNCIKKWFKENYPDEYNLNEFRPCCTNEEFDVIINSYTIIKNKYPTGNDMDIVTAIIIYYYFNIVLPYYVLNSIDTKYINAKELFENEEGYDKYIANENGEQYVLDNIGYVYSVTNPYISDDDKITINNLETNDVFYLDKNGKIYDVGYSQRAINPLRLNCFDKIYKPTVSKIVDDITTNNENWASQVRKIIQNFNTEEFVGGKKKKNKRLKTKKHIKRKNNKSKKYKL